VVNIPIYTGTSDLERGGNPLRKFTGRFIGSGDDEANKVIFQHMVENRQTPVVDLNFISIRDVVSIVPYSYPTAQITINYRTNAQSGKPSDRGGWGLLLLSLKELDFITSAGAKHNSDDECDLTDVLGQDLTMEMEPDHDYGQTQDGQQMSGPVWRVVAIGTGGAPAPTETIEDAAIRVLGQGLDRTAFTEAALEDSVLRTVNAAVVDGSFIAGLINTGKIKEEGGIFKPI